MKFGKQSYLVDIFEKLNDLNLSLQGEISAIITSASKIQAFKNKHSLWQTELNKNNTDMFPCLNDFFKENNIDIFTLKNIISNHIEELKEKFSRRFKDFPENVLDSIRDPFFYDICSSTLQISEKEQLIDLVSDYTLRNQFSTQPFAKNFVYPWKSNSLFYARRPSDYKDNLHQRIYAKLDSAN
ncbi:uncharacterized protein TNCV_54391 [Trichonephila clavipes]|nr:uncharacterized protein TNCV_54391 [Trichonephila clavipes]